MNRRFIDNSFVYDALSERMDSDKSQSSFFHDENKENQMIKKINDYQKILKGEYLKSILNPEAHISKIPSRMPCESTVAPLKWNFTITPNASGKFALIIDPFNQTGWLYQDSTVNGTGSGTLTSLTFAQDSTIVDQWRLVSSSLILKYYGNFNQLSGFFVGATTSNVNAATQTTFLTFNNVEDLSNRQVLKCSEGIKLVYSPMDEKATEFSSQSSYSGGSHPSRWQYLFVIVGDAFPNSSCIRADYFRNIEYTSTPAYKEYIPQKKDLPGDPVIPNIVDQVQFAPVDFKGSRNSKLGDRFTDLLLDKGVDYFSQFLTGLTNPLNMFKF